MSCVFAVTTLAQHALTVQSAQAANQEHTELLTITLQHAYAINIILMMVQVKLVRLANTIAALALLQILVILAILINLEKRTIQYVFASQPTMMLGSSCAYFAITPASIVITHTVAKHAMLVITEIFSISVHFVAVCPGTTTMEQHSASSVFWDV